jgi:hypothetical protein
MEPYELLQFMAKLLEASKIPYLVTGSMASMAYGEPRLTNDIDIVAAMEEEHVREFVKAFDPEKYYVSAEMIRNAIARSGQFNIIHSDTGLKVDVMIKEKTPFDESRFKRTQRINITDTIQVSFASPEDVIIKKMEFFKAGGSEKHIRDITGMLKVSGAEIDRKYISSWAAQLGLTKIWETILKRLEK